MTFFVFCFLFFFIFIFWWNEAAPGPYALLVGPYAFFRPYNFDAYGPPTGPFFLWFSKEIAQSWGRTGDMIPPKQVDREFKDKRGGDFGG